MFAMDLQKSSGAPLTLEWALTEVIKGISRQQTLTQISGATKKSVASVEAEEEGGEEGKKKKKKGKGGGGGGEGGGGAAQQEEEEGTEEERGGARYMYMYI